MTARCLFALAGFVFLTSSLRAQTPPTDAPPSPSEKVLVDRVELEKLIDAALKNRDDAKKKKDDEDKKAKELNGHPVGSLLGMTAVWRNGVWIETEHKDFKLHPGGTFHYDFGWYTADQILQYGPMGTGPFNDGANLRRGRVRLEGTAYELIDFEFVYEFSNGFSSPGLTVPPSDATVANAPGPTELWVGVHDVPWFGRFRIGNQKEFFSLEHLTSHRYTEFMERSPLADFTQVSAFNNGYNPGISTDRTWCDSRIYTGYGFYKNLSDIGAFGVGDGQYAFTSRVVGLPIFEDDGERLFHIGGAYSHRDPVNDRVRLRARDSVRAQPFPLMNIIVDTGQIIADSHDMFNVETAAVFGPLTLQAEYTGQLVHGAHVGNGPNQGTLFFQGAYVQALLFLTGEKRPYNRKSFVWDRIIPNEPWFFTDSCGGWIFGKGAWEFGVRYSYLDFSDNLVQAGRLDDLTIGLNWYWNPNAKMQFNYDIARKGDFSTSAQGVVQAFGIRTAFDF